MAEKDIDLVDLSEDPAIQPLLTGGDLTFIRCVAQCGAYSYIFSYSSSSHGSEGAVFVVREDYYGQACERVVDRGNL